MRIIGLSGYAMSGKDTVGKFLAELGYERVAFADKVRLMVYRTDPEARRLIDLIGQDKSDVQAKINEAKYQSTYVREALQLMGQYAREILDPNIWIHAALDNLDPTGKYCVTDVRYRNEVQTIEARGGICVRVDRAGVGPINNHVSELDLEGYKFLWYITNDGTLDNLRNIVHNWEPIIWKETHNVESISNLVEGNQPGR